MECAVNSIEMAINLFTKDLQALSDEQVLAPVAGSARTAVDITYEVAVINQRIAMYHDGQLNVMQCVCGDLAMHWN